MAFLFRLQDSASPHSLRTKAHRSNTMAAAAPMLKIRTPEEAGMSRMLQYPAT